MYEERLCKWIPNVYQVYSLKISKFTEIVLKVIWNLQENFLKNLKKFSNLKLFENRALLGNIAHILT